MKEWMKNLSVYEPGKPIETVARELGFKNIDEIIKVASNENELGPSPLAIQAIMQNAKMMNRYPDGGAFSIKAKLSEKLKVDPNNLILGNGSNELIEFLGNSLLTEENNWVISEGSFAAYSLIANIFQSNPIVTPMKDFGHDLDAMAKAITPSTVAVILCNPNNPTGTFLKSSEIEKFLAQVPEEVLIIVDEAYIEYTNEADRFDFIAEIRKGRKNLLVLRTFSKIYGLAGLRVGYGVGNAEWIDYLNRVRQPFNVNLMGLKAAEAALDDEEHLKKSKKINEEGLAYFTEQFKKIGLKYVPSYANFILVKTGQGRKVFTELQKQKVIVRAMDGYKMPDWIRITVGTREQNQKVFHALKEVLSQLDQSV